MPAEAATSATLRPEVISSCREQSGGAAGAPAAGWTLKTRMCAVERGLRCGGVSHVDGSYVRAGVGRRHALRDSSDRG